MRTRLLLTICLVLFTISPIHSQPPEWKTLPEMPRARFGHCSVVYQDRVWLIGGKSQFNSSISEIDCYNLITGQWEPNASQLLHARYNAAATVYQDKIFVIGGQNDRQLLSSVEYYDPGDKKWKEWTPLLYPREGANAVVFNSILYVIGGIRSKGLFITPTDVIEFWDEASQNWQESSSWRLQKARVLMQSVVVDSFVYILGGRFIDGQYNFVERFGLSSGTESRQPLNIPRFYFAAVRIQSLIYVLGGVSFGDFDSLANKIEYYATNYDRWYTLNIYMRQPRAGLSAVSYNNSIYVFGGMDLSLKVSIAAEVLTGVPTKVDTSATVITEHPVTRHPDRHQLLKNYPNPFNSATTISFELAKDKEQVQLIIFNLMGEKVRTFLLNSYASGVHQIEWDGRDDQGRMLESGVYLAQLRSDQQYGKVLKLSFVK